MVRRTFSGREVTKALTKYGYVPKSRHGSHVRLRYEHPETGEVRNVDVPQHDELKIGTLRSIADQCGAKDFHSWCEWIEQTL
ncbi:MULTISPECIES: type II toxin-antitoxin system HicA family toxin [Haloferax]|jgi:predicted RNA binding protein YcfA (HicA-like mRNA interferase family)|uniref:UPF0395 family protein n=3 Tax=Haloferax TaxID=2251 RepID=D4H097_HALVD|nr:MULTISPECIES: type II toxin-antitoxin system HicA family toxin [Haloferax]ADE05228.1 UPF0395 family protein [Haloferax volcanii DS2]MBS8121317.1 type II toxin-antitoxin system HicA family toxin [Haloferax volcanii]MBS8126325.1 type II toxin-antitoxin system HicA family toxin [Haloferax volcanii]MBS8130195.1 type II toxin-antitoxin system HicA family toxin [Haloferax volcanii]MBS8134069.1 type II toxin-antitoxin system HicA family toxin [Haloferax volcanii]